MKWHSTAAGRMVPGPGIRVVMDRDTVLGRRMVVKGRIMDVVAVVHILDGLPPVLCVSSFRRSLLRRLPSE